MAMKLFAHAMRIPSPGAGPDDDATHRSRDALRWMFRDLVVRRDGFAPWGLSSPAQSHDAATVGGEPAGESLWADTVPGCRE